MENAAEALKMAFAVFVFVIALTLVFSVISQARATADAVFKLHDRDVSFYDELEGTTNLSSYRNNSYRTVGWSTVVPTIYRYKMENYGVTIIDEGSDNPGHIVARFSEKTEDVAQNYFKNKKNNISKDHVKYLNEHILKTVNSTPELKEYDDADNNSTSNSLYQLFFKLYKLDKANQDFGALWLNNDEYMVDRLDADLGEDENKEATFSSGKHKGLGLANKTSKNGKKYKNESFIEYFKTVETTKPNGDTDTIFEIIYVVQ